MGEGEETIETSFTKLIKFRFKNSLNMHFLREKNKTKQTKNITFNRIIT